MSGEREPNPYSEPGTVELEVRARDIAVVTLRGEHDQLTELDISEALTRACEHRGVLVDLSPCRFIDSSTIGVIVTAGERLLSGGGRVVVVIPLDAPVIGRAAHLAGLDAALPVYDSRDAGLSAMHGTLEPRVSGSEEP
jgi:anti-anti-sigma factor